MLAPMRPEKEPRVRLESVVAPAVSEPRVAPPTALSWPAIVVEPVTESTLVVALKVEIPAKWLVEEALIELVKRIAVEVELAARPKVEAPGVNHAPTESVPGVT